jgi:hypothetical protein
MVGCDIIRVYIAKILYYCISFRRLIMKHSVSQRVISTLLALLVVLGSFAVSAAAATTEEEYGGSYGYIIPTDSNLSAQ